MHDPRSPSSSRHSIPLLADPETARAHAPGSTALELARLAAHEGLALTVDAEEADRLEISLEVIEALARDTQTSSWPGLGIAVQAYGGARRS